MTGSIVWYSVDNSNRRFPAALRRISAEACLTSMKSFACGAAPRTGPCRKANSRPTDRPTSRTRFHDCDREQGPVGVLLPAPAALSTLPDFEPRERRHARAATRLATFFRRTPALPSTCLRRSRVTRKELAGSARAWGGAPLRGTRLTPCSSNPSACLFAEPLTETLRRAQAATREPA